MRQLERLSGPSLAGLWAVPVRRFFRFSALAVLDKNVAAFFAQTPLLFLGRWAGPEQAAILKNSDMMIFMTSEQAGVLNVHPQLVSETEESAAQIEQVARGLLAFASLQTQNPPLQKFIQAVSIARSGRSLGFEWSASSADLFVLLKSWEQIRGTVNTPSE